MTCIPLLCMLKHLPYGKWMETHVTGTIAEQHEPQA